MEQSVLKEPLSLTTKIKLLLGVFILFASVCVFLVLSPQGFPSGEIITIKKDSSLGEASYLLKERGFIRSRIAFEFCMISFGGEKHVVARDYLFKEPMNACALASRIARGISGVPALKVTIPEGTSNQGIANILAKSIPAFDSKIFIDEARAREGYLFPDTYFFHSATSVYDVVNAMENNFEQKINSLKPAIDKSGHSLRDVVIMASILEKEAQTPEDQALVAGVLWKRIEIGMPIQVDAPFYYLLGKGSSELTLADLAMVSGYNTYKNKGLPVGPIGNPGLSAIRSAIYPTPSPYLYYLSDKNNVMHYGKTFEDHKANKIKYLR